MGALKIWDLDQLAVNVLGVTINSGYGEGEVIKIEFAEDQFVTKRGADGEVTRSKTYCGEATITLTLMQTASANALLSAVHQVDLAGHNGAGVGVFGIKDLGGATTYFASKAWIAGPPNPTYGREATHRDWKIMCADLKGVEGGN